MNFKHQLRILKQFLMLSLSNPVSSGPVSTCSGTLLIVKLDAIGDYILFRNFLEEVNRSKQFADYRITLCGNSVWRQLAEELDKEYVDDFIWVSIKDFGNERKYRWRILEEVRGRGFEIAIQPTYSRRLLYGDVIIRASGARKRIGCIVDSSEQALWQRMISNRYYTKLIDTSVNGVFEFNRNRTFFETFLDKTLKIHKPFIASTERLHNINSWGKYAVLFLGASDSFKRWSAQKFAAIADYLNKKYNYTIVIGGSREETDAAAEILSKADIPSIIDYTGKTTLIGLISILKNAEILISNDTCSIHIATALGTKTVCIASGGHYGRFIPYPQTVTDTTTCVYPDEIKMLAQDENMVYKLLSDYNSGQDVNSISAEDVFEAIGQLMTK